MEALQTKLVNKEEISGFHFPNIPLQRSEQEVNDLVSKLSVATRLGNIEHGKIKIIFQDDEGVKEVRTTIWATGEKFVVLKKGVIIPINRIIDVKIY